MEQQLEKPARARRSTARQAGEATRERMLDAAEKLFALHDFHGTSLRDVAREVDAPIALVTYHFESKENLLDRVVERRASFMALCRIKALDQARTAVGDEPVPLRRLIEAYVWPFIERSSQGGPGWKHYSQFVARLANSPQWNGVISKHYDSVARQYIAEFRRTLAGVNEVDVIHGFSFMTGVMVHAVAEPGRVESLSHGKLDGSDLQALFARMVPFLESGFESLRHKPAKPPRG
jgi:AcrR family transcriptional regulator